MQAAVGGLLLLLGIALGICLVLWLDDTEPVDPYTEAELDAMEAVDRLFQASEQSREEMRQVAGQEGTRRGPSSGTTP